MGIQNEDTIGSGRPLRSDKISDVAVKIRLTQEERIIWKERAIKEGFNNMSEWVRFLVKSS